jgi:hypothetical protein
VLCTRRCGLLLLLRVAGQIVRRFELCRRFGTNSFIQRGALKLEPVQAGHTSFSTVVTAVITMDATLSQFNRSVVPAWAACSTAAAQKECHYSDQGARFMLSGTYHALCKVSKTSQC